MGITGLLPTLKDACIEISLPKLQGTVAVIDTYCWLHKALFPVSMEVYQGKPVNAHITFCMRRVQELRKHQIKPIFVFDGRDLAAKEETERLREQNRAKARQELDQLIRQRKMTEAHKKVSRCVDITPDLARQLIERLIEEKIDYLVAPYEADAQIAYLVRNGFADYAISEDSDLILYGCDYVLYKLDADGYGSLFQLHRLSRCLNDLHKGGFDFDTFKRMCILSGCDYLSNIPGIGLQKAKRFFASNNFTDMRKALPRLPSVLNMKKTIVTSDYIRRFQEAENTFKYQLVYCPHSKRMRPVTNYDENQAPEQMPYAGEHLDDHIAMQFALGNVDFESMHVIDHQLMDKLKQTYFESKHSIWSDDYVRTQKRQIRSISDRLNKSINPKYDDQEGDDQSKNDSLESLAKKRPRLSSPLNRSEIGRKGDTSLKDDGEIMFISEEDECSSPISRTNTPKSSRSSTMITTMSEERQKSSNKKVIYKSRFFQSKSMDRSIITSTSINMTTASQESDSIGSDIDEILESRQQVKRKISMLYNSKSKMTGSQSSADSGFDSKCSQSSSQ